ncbi:MAG: hypothetical protein NXI32_29170 [bacterium]|nr:hypothetical protein [bacterium]
MNFQKARSHWCYTSAFSTALLASVWLQLTTPLLGQTAEQFQQNSQELDFSSLGTRLLPPGLTEATDLATVKALRAKTAEQTVAALQARYESGLDNINFLLNAQISLALAQLDTTDDREQQLKFIQAGLNASILTWQRIKELQNVGARGGDAAAEAQARAEVYRFYVWWHKWKAGEDIFLTLIPGTPSNNVTPVVSDTTHTIASQTTVYICPRIPLCNPNPCCQRRY